MSLNAPALANVDVRDKRLTGRLARIQRPTPTWAIFSQDGTMLLLVPLLSVGILIAFTTVR
jgi:hypothetical protein